MIGKLLNLNMKTITFKINLKHLDTLREDLYREWKIWSACFGKVLVINGTSSSGKTTLSKYLHKFGFILVSQDDTCNDMLFDYFSKSTKNMFLAKSFLTSSDLKHVMCGYKIKENNYKKDEIRIVKALQDEIYSVVKDYHPTSMELYDRIYANSKKFIFSGQDVVIDICNPNIDVLSYSFNYYPMKIGLLYAPLEENLKKCFQRNYISLKAGESDDRYPGEIMNQYTDFYKFVPKDSVSKNDKILDKIDKEVIKNILEIAVCCEYRLIDCLQYLRIHDDIPYALKKKCLDRAVTKLKNTMMLESSEEVFVVPAVKYDFIVKTFGFKADYKEVLAAKELRTENYTEANPESSVGYDLVKSSLVANILNNRFIIYYSNPTVLPTIIGNTGPIVELEYESDNGRFRLIETKVLMAQWHTLYLPYPLNCDIIDVLPTYDDAHDLLDQRHLVGELNQLLDAL